MNQATPQSTRPHGKASPEAEMIQQLKKLYKIGQHGQVFSLAFQGILKYPDSKRMKMWLGFALKEMSIPAFREDVKEALTICLQTPGLEHQNFYPGWIRTLLLDPANTYLQELRMCPDDSAFDALFDLDKLKPLANESLFLEGLRNLIIPEPGLEKVLTRIRKKFLLLTSSFSLPDDFLPLQAAIAQICFFNEYAFFETGEETAQIKPFEDVIVAGDETLQQLCVYAAYRPLHRLENAQALLKKYKAEEPLSDLMLVQLEAPLKQEALKQEITEIDKIENTTSEKVQEMYEENPYPRWKMVNVPQNAVSAADGTWLVAGCGTCKPTAQEALIFPSIQFQAIDLSKTSLSYGMLKAQEMNIQNISFAHCDILKVEKLGRKFDVIESTGVLHHMKDPVEGWKKLLACLNPGGLMHIGLYSTLARQDIVEARAYVKEKSYPADNNGIRQFRQDVIAMPEDHPIKPVERRKDFHYMSGCRDLVFHVQESTYTLPELKEILDDLGLTLTHFCLHNIKFKQMYQKKFPQDSTLTNLSYWHRLEEANPFIFSGMYVFLCCRKDEVDKLNPTAKIVQETIYASLLGKN